MIFAYSNSFRKLGFHWWSLNLSLFKNCILYINLTTSSTKQSKTFRFFCCTSVGFVAYFRSFVILYKDEIWLQIKCSDNCDTFLAVFLETSYDPRCAVNGDEHDFYFTNEIIIFKWNHDFVLIFKSNHDFVLIFKSNHDFVLIFKSNHNFVLIFKSNHDFVLIFKSLCFRLLDFDLKSL